MHLWTANALWTAASLYRMHVQCSAHPRRAWGILACNHLARRLERVACIGKLPGLQQPASRASTAAPYAYSFDASLASHC